MQFNILYLFRHKRNKRAVSRNIIGNKRIYLRQSEKCDSEVSAVANRTYNTLYIKRWLNEDFRQRESEQ